MEAYWALGLLAAVVVVRIVAWQVKRALDRKRPVAGGAAGRAITLRRGRVDSERARDVWLSDSGDTVPADPPSQEWAHWPRAVSR